MRAKAETKGFVMITVALLLVILLAFGALAIDVGMFYASRTAAQHAADSAALAGAYTFVFAPNATQPATAQSHALNVALNSKIMSSSILAADVTVQVDVPNQRVTVDITHNEKAYLFSVLGIASGNIHVQALAEAALHAVGSGCAKPWFIPNTFLSTAALCGTGNACAANEVMILPDGTVNHPFVDPLLGTQRTIKPGNPQNSLVPGQFFAIRLGDSTGGNDYKTNIATCAAQIVTCQNTYGVEPGNMIGPTKQGVLDLIGNPADTFVGFDSNGVPVIQPGAGGSTTPSSRSIVVAPIWDVCSMGAYCDSKGNFQLPSSGATIQIPVVGFALIFIDGVSGNDVLAHLLGVFGCGSVPVGNPDVTGPFSVPVRLVRAP